MLWTHISPISSVLHRIGSPLTFTTTTRAGGDHLHVHNIAPISQSKGQKNVSKFIPFYFVWLPFGFRSLLKRRSFSVGNSFHFISLHLVSLPYMRSHADRHSRDAKASLESISSSTCVGTAFSAPNLYHEVEGEGVYMYVYLQA